MAIYEVHAGSWRRHDDGGFLSYVELAEQLYTLTGLRGEAAVADRFLIEARAAGRLQHPNILPMFEAVKAV